MAIKDVLKAHDVKPTIVRIKIYDYLITNKNHPTADKLYKSLIDEIPTLSRTSVYNTMELFTRKNLVQTLTIEEKETRFDADTSCHGHFKCTECTEVFDFQVDISDIKHGLPADFMIIERHLYYKGLCSNCRQTTLPS